MKRHQFYVENEFRNFHQIFRLALILYYYLNTNTNLDFLNISIPGLNSTLQGQLTGKIVEVENDNALTLCIAHIFNEAGQKLAIGVINKDRYIATNTKALLGLRKVKIEFSDGIKKYSSCDFLFYGGHIIQIGVSISKKIAPIRIL